MKTWKNILVGIFIGLLISSPIVYSAISSEVGVNGLDIISSGWRQITSSVAGTSTNTTNFRGLNVVSVPIVQQNAGGTAFLRVGGHTAQVFSTDSAGQLHTASFLYGLDTPGGPSTDAWSPIGQLNLAADSIFAGGANQIRGLVTASIMYGERDAATFDRIRTVGIGDGTTGTGLLGIGIFGFNGATGFYNRISEFPAANADGISTTTREALNVNAFTYMFNGVTSDRIRGDTTNGLDVDVTRVQGTVTTTSAGSATPSDTFANPTTAVTAWALLGGFDTSTGQWERLRANGSNIDDIAVETTGSLNIRSLSFEFDNNQFDRVRHSFLQTTTGITTNAAGTAVDMTNTPMSKYSMIIDRTVGATDAVAINLECSYDGTIWPGTTQSLIQVTTLAVEPTRNSFGDAPCNYMRYNVVTVGAGNTLTIQLIATR